MFQSTPSRRGRPESDGRHARPSCFNPRPREEGDVAPGERSACLDCFNPRPREEGDYIYADHLPSQDRFNPRPREEGDIIESSLAEDGLVSIHALAKRATAAPPASLPHQVEVSIHALAKRATTAEQPADQTPSRFNPRPREEGDHDSSFLASVHPRFQSTPSRRGRPIRRRKRPPPKRFQSTPSRRGRHFHIAITPRWS